MIWRQVFIGNVGLGLEGGVGIGIVFGLALFDPVVQLVRESVNRGFFQVFVAIDGKPLAPLPALHGADFAAKMGGDLFPGNQFLVLKGGPFGARRRSSSDILG